MTLNEFVNHIKHNSLSIHVRCFNKDIPEYHGTFGDFKNSVYKHKYGDIEISHCYPNFKHDDTLHIMLDIDCARAFLESEKEV